MSLHEVDGKATSWDRPLAGSLDLRVVRSEALADNPLGDPALRPLYVSRPPEFEVAAGDGPPLPGVYMLQGFGGRVEEWLAPDADGLTTVERLDSMFAAGESAPALIVFVDAWTSRGGSQFLNSTSIGHYLDYVCDEVVPFVDARYPTLAAREHRGMSGKALIPFDSLTGRPIEDLWARWLALDPVRMAAEHVEALAGMRRIYIGAGRQDEFFLDLGALALSGELTRLGVEHSLELFDGNHDGVDRRMPAIRELTRALQR